DRRIGINFSGGCRKSPQRARDGGGDKRQLSHSNLLLPICRKPNTGAACLFPVNGIVFPSHPQHRRRPTPKFTTSRNRSPCPYSASDAPAAADISARSR